MVLSYKSNPYNFVPILVNRKVNQTEWNVRGWRAKALAPLCVRYAHAPRDKGKRGVRAMRALFYITNKL